MIGNPLAIPRRAIGYRRTWLRSGGRSLPAVSEMVRRENRFGKPDCHGGLDRIRTYYLPLCWGCTSACASCPCAPLRNGALFSCTGRPESNRPSVGRGYDGSRMNPTLLAGRIRRQDPGKFTILQSGIHGPQNPDFGICVPRHQYPQIPAAQM